MLLCRIPLSPCLSFANCISVKFSSFLKISVAKNDTNSRSKSSDIFCTIIDIKELSLIGSDKSKLSQAITDAKHISKVYILIINLTIPSKRDILVEFSPS